MHQHAQNGPLLQPAVSNHKPNDFTMLADILLSAFGTFSALGMMGPQVWKIWKRKKAQDFSKTSAAIGMSTQLVWLGYSVYLGALPLIITNATWALMLVINILLIWRYQATPTENHGQRTCRHPTSAGPHGSYHEERACAS
jgi:uncharacterized protein with PQ loop repeat